jgi:Ubiquitin carboxyl-terminal hydrolase
VLHIPCADGSTVVYDLHAVLHHRGTLSTSGHYVAEVLDPASQRWFMCDDESVTDTKARSAAAASGSSAAAAAAAAASYDWDADVFEYDGVVVSQSLCHCYSWSCLHVTLLASALVSTCWCLTQSQDY